MLNSIYIINNTVLLENYGFNLIIANILIYILSLTILFFVFFFFNLNDFSSLSNIKIFSNSNFFFGIVIFSFLSFTGIPPLLGFVGKFLMIIYINIKFHFILVFIFIIINLFMIYFYIQNFKFLVKKTNLNSINSNTIKNELNIVLIQIVVFFSFFLLFGIFIFDDFFLILNSCLFF